MRVGSDVDAAALRRVLETQKSAMGAHFFVVACKAVADVDGDATCKDNAMLDRLAEAISFISMAPWLRPAFAFALSIVSSSLGWFASDVPWATIVLVLSIALALWAYAEGLVGTVSGFVASFVGFYLLVGLTGNLTTLRVLPHGCIAIDGNTANDCIDAAISKPSRH